MHHSWNSINTLEQLAEIEQKSYVKPVAIFKHSTRCGISAMAEHSLKHGWNWTEDDLDFYHLDLLTHRYISNEIAERYKVVHQSPQLIWMISGKAQDVRTHHAIDPDIIETWLSKRAE